MADDPRLSRDVVDEIMAMPSVESIRRRYVVERDARTDISALVADALELYLGSVPPIS